VVGHSWNEGPWWNKREAVIPALQQLKDFQASLGHLQVTFCQELINWPAPLPGVSKAVLPSSVLKLARQRNQKDEFLNGSNQIRRAYMKPNLFCAFSRESQDNFEPIGRQIHAF
jgi:hypothetical protein